MAVSSQGELFSALAAGGDFDALLGTPETDWLDFKRTGYRLEEKRGKWDLARDVAAFANAQGGCLVLGVETAQQTHEIAELAVKVRPVAKATINPEPTSTRSRRRAIRSSAASDFTGSRPTRPPRTGCS